MAIVLDHTIVPAHDKVASARFFARIFGLAYNGPHSHFAPVQVNEALTLDFDERPQFDMHHYAFRVSEPEFDAIFGRVKGIVAVEGVRGPVVVHAVQHVAHRPVELEDWPDGDRRSRLVFITRNLGRAPIEALFAAVGAVAGA